MNPIPEGVNPATAGPLLCGGATVFSPFINQQILPIHRIGVVGIGGLGHLAVKFGKAWGCEVTAFTSSDSKRTEALELGAHKTISSVDPKEIAASSSYFDRIIVTVNVDLDWQSYVSTLRPDGKIIFVGAPPSPLGIQAFSLVDGDKQISGSSTGSRTGIDKMLEFCARHQIEPQCEHFDMKDINTAVDRLRNNKLRYRAVLKADFE